jgi:hypothetical protein
VGQLHTLLIAHRRRRSLKLNRYPALQKALSWTLISIRQARENGSGLDDIPQIRQELWLEIICSWQTSKVF